MKRLEKLQWMMVGVLAIALCALLGACSSDPSSPEGEASAPSLTPVHLRAPLWVRAHQDGVGSTGSTSQPPIVFGGSAVQLGAYDVTNSNDVDDAVTTFDVAVLGGRMSFARLGYYWDDATSDGVTSVTPEDDGTATFTPTRASGSIAAGSVRTLRLVGITADVGSFTSFARSGDVVSLKLTSLVGLDGTEAELDEGLIGSSYLLRRSLPHFVPVEVTPPPLMPGRPYLISWGVRAGVTGDIAIKQFGLHLNLQHLQLCYFQLHRGSHFMDPRDYAITALSSESGLRDLKQYCTDTTGDVAVTFAEEEIVRAGTEMRFGIRVTVNTVDAEASVTTSFETLNLFATDPLMCLDGPVIYLPSSPNRIPGIIWSDLSIAPHSDVPCLSSADWTGDGYIENIAISQTLQ